MSGDSPRPVSMCVAVLAFLALAPAAAAEFGPAPPPSVRVTSPAAGQTWHPGETRVITWAREGPGKSASVQIWLKKLASDDPLRSIAAAASNSGSYAWTVPADVAEGSYLVRVAETGPGAPWDDSDAFAIRKARLLGSDAPRGREQKPAPCLVTVTRPLQGQTCRIGDPCTIAWDTATTKEAHRTVFLFLQLISAQNPQGVEGGGFPVANSGTYQWVIPENFGNVDDYFSFHRVRLVTPDHRCQGFSAGFNIAPRLLAPKPPAKVRKP